MRGLLLFLLLSIYSVANPLAYEGAYYFTQYYKVVAKGVTALITTVVGANALQQIEQDYRVIKTVQYVPHPNEVALIQEKVNVTYNEADECLNRVAFGVEYQEFTKWTDSLNRAVHACGHNYSNPRGYLETTRKTYSVVASSPSWKNKWNIKADRYEIYRDNRALILTKQGLIISSFNSFPRGKVVAGGLTTKKYRQAMGWR